MFNNYPYTDFHELNLDWFLSQFKTLTDEWSNIKVDWDELYTYVHDYFDNLDLQDEVDNKLNQMAEDGIITTAILKPYFVSPEMFGAVGDGVADDTEALKEALKHDVVLMTGTYLTTEALIFNGSKILGHGTIIGDIDGFVLTVGSLDFSLVGNTTTAITKGDSNIPIAHITSDHFCIMSPNTFNPARSYYQDGEFNFTAIPYPYNSSYPAGSIVYNINFKKTDLDVNIINNSYITGSGAVKVICRIDSTIKGVYVCNGDYSLYMDRCFNCNIAGEYYNNSDTYHGLNYAICIGNSQNINVKAIGFSLRHGITTGGDNNPCNIVCRNINIDGIYITRGNVSAINLHGNAENVKISGLCNYGCDIGGKDVTIDDLIIENCITNLKFTEIISGRFSVNNVIIKNAPAYSIQISLIDDEDYDFIISNVLADSTYAHFAGIVGTGTNNSLDLRFNGCNFKNANLLNNVSGSTAVNVTAIDCSKPFCSNINSLTGYKLVIPASLEFSAETAVLNTFAFGGSLPTTYNAVFEPLTYPGGVPIISRVASKSSSGVRMAFNTTNLSSATGTLTGNVIVS